MGGGWRLWKKPAFIYITLSSVVYRNRRKDCVRKQIMFGIRYCEIAQKRKFFNVNWNFLRLYIWQHSKMFVWWEIKKCGFRTQWLHKSKNKFQYSSLVFTKVNWQLIYFLYNFYDGSNLFPELFLSLNPDLIFFPSLSLES